jgi:UDP:flavonoid glycosyltransferase YjiC (YdhE family)
MAVSGPRVLYVSSSIGLGHASKDLAIARELRRAQPDIELVWLAGQPASEVLQREGERLLPDVADWAGASAIAERTARDGQLDLVRYVYRSLPSWWANSRVVLRVVDAYDIDLIVGNEAYELDVPLVAHVMRLPVPFVLILDFVGTAAMTRGVVDRVGAWGLNALWSLDGSVYGHRPHSAIFIGELEDIPDEPLGVGLPNRREHAATYYEAVGHAIGFDPLDYGDTDANRQHLGYGTEPLVVCSVGGTAIGRELLEMCGAAFPALREALPGLRMVLACGPRLAVDSVTVPAEVEVRGLVPRLYEHFACADVAVVQCGASSTTELAALERPFVYVPVEGHFEQEVVAARLARHRIGRRVSLSESTPESLAEAILGEYGRQIEPCPMPVDGARKAAEHILRSLPT